MRRATRRKPSEGRRQIVVGVVCANTCERQSLVLALRASGGLEAVDCGAGVADSIARVRDLSIDLVLTALEVGPAASFAASLLSAIPRVRPVALLRSESEGALARLAAAGIVGFIEQSADLGACARGLRAVYRHGFYCPPNLAATVLRSKPSQPPTRQPGPVLSGGRLHGRRLEVAECIANGLSNKEISTRLSIAEGTVKNHVHAVLQALSLQHRWEVAGALRQEGSRLGLIAPRKDEEKG